MNRKRYKLTNEKSKTNAIKSFSSVTVGGLGGFIEHEDNLSQEYDASLVDNAWVCGDATVLDDAWVDDNTLPTK